MVESKTSIKVSKGGIFSIILAFVLFFLPYLTVTWLNKPLDTEIESVYLSSFVTASGILLGFIGSSILSKTERVEYETMSLVMFNFAFFVYAVFRIFLGSLEGMPTISMLSYITGSLFSNAGTVLILMRRLRLRKM